MTSFVAPAPEPSPLSPLVPLNSPMVGFASPFGHSDGQNRDLILEAIRAWASANLLTWSTQWQLFFTTWLPAIEAYVTANATTGYSWRSTATPIIPSTTTTVTITVGITPSSPLRVGDLVADQTTDTNYGVVTTVIDLTHAVVTWLGYLHGLQGSNVVPADTAVAGYINTAGTQTRAAGDLRYDRVDSLMVNVKTHGAIGDNTTDDTAAFQASLNSLPSGGVVWVPHAAYKISGLLTIPAGVVMRGSSAYGSTLIFSSATGDLITLGTSAGIQSMQLTTSVPRTGGSSVMITGSGAFVKDTTLTNYYVGITVGTLAGSSMIGVVLNNLGMFAPTVVDTLSGAVHLVNFGDANINNVNISGPGSGAQPAYGMRIETGDTLTMSDCNITLHGIALNVSTPNPKAAVALKFANCLFDSAGAFFGGGSAEDVYFNHSGYVYDVQFVNCWFGLSTSGSGCFLYPQTGGALDGIQFSNCSFHHNGHSGLRVQGPLVKNLTVTGCHAGGNTNYGITINNASSLFVLNGNMIGPIANNAANGTGINLDATANTRYVITNNVVLGNTSAQILDASTGTPDRIVANNLTA